MARMFCKVRQAGKAFIVETFGEKANEMPTSIEFFLSGSKGPLEMAELERAEHRTVHLVVEAKLAAFRPVQVRVHYPFHPLAGQFEHYSVPHLLVRKADGVSSGLDD